MKRFGVLMIVLVILATVIVLFFGDFAPLLRDRASPQEEGRGTEVDSTADRKPDATAAPADASASPGEPATTEPGEDPAGEDRLAGIVVDQEGRPLAGATIRCFQDRAGDPRILARMETLDAVSAADGRFSIKATPNKKWRIHANLSGYFDADRDEPRTASTGDANVEIVLTSGAVVSGRVLDQSRQPLAGITVSATRRHKNGTQTYGADPTNELGQFELDGLHAGTNWISAIDPKIGSARVELELEIGQRQEGLELVLEIGLEIRGHVRHPDGAPVEGALLTFSGNGVGLLNFDEDRKLKSDSSGAFAIRGLIAGRYEIEASLENGHTDVSATLAAGTLDAVLVLARGAIVRGRVALPDGSPAGDGHIRIEIESENSGLGAGDSFQQSIFEVTGLPAGTLSISAGNSEFGQSESVVLELTEGGVFEDVLLVLGTTVSIRGTVTDTGGAPLVDASVLAWSVSEQRGNMSTAGRATSGVDGGFEIRGLIEGDPYLLDASKTGYLRTMDQAEHVSAVGGDEGIVLLLELGAVISGQVMSAAGPLEGARISLSVNRNPLATASKKDSRKSSNRFEVETDLEGSYQIEGIIGGNYEMRCYLAGYPEFEPKQFEIATGARMDGVDFIALGSGEIKGRVIDAEDNPISQALIQAKPEIPGRLRSAVNTQTDRDGSFILCGLSESGYDLECTAQGFTLASGAIPPRAVAPGANIEIRMERLGVVIGSVRARSSAAPESYTVKLLSAANPGAKTTSLTVAAQVNFPGSQESFELKVSDERRQFTGLLVTADGFRPVHVDISDFDSRGKNDVGLILLDEGGSLAVKVTNESGAPVEDAIVEARTVADVGPVTETMQRVSIGQNHGEWTNASGEAMIMSVLPGRYRIDVSHKLHASAHVIIDIPDKGNAAPLLVQLGNGGTIHGRATYSSGEPAVDIRVKAAYRVGETEHSKKCETDSEGRFRIGGLRAGEIDVTATYGDFFYDGGSGTIAKRVTLVDHEEVEVNFGTDDSCRIYGVVRGLRKVTTPQRSSSRLSLISAPGFVPELYNRAVIDEQGAYEFLAVMPGTYMLERPDGCIEALTVPKARELRLDLQLAGGAIRGRVLRADRETSEHAMQVSAHLRGSDGSSIAHGKSHSIAADGQFEICYLEPGVYDIQAKVAGYGSAVFAGVRLAPDETKSNLDILISPSATMVVRVRDSAGAPCSADIVLVHQSGIETRSGSEHDATAPGEYRIRDLIPGSYRVIAIAPDAPLVWQDGVAVRSDSEAVVELRLPTAGAPLAISVADPAHTDRTRLRIMDSSGLLVFSTTIYVDLRSTDGIQHTPSLPPGYYTLIATSWDDKRAEAAVTIGATGTPVPVLLTLTAR